MFGAGEVTKIDTSNTIFPVLVRVGGMLERYTLNGKYQLHATQTLFPYPVEIVKEDTKPSIDWDHVAPKYKYLSEDSEGNAFLSEKEPFIAATDVWGVYSGETAEANGFASYVKGTCDWKDSLIKRPDSS